MARTISPTTPLRQVLCLLALECGLVYLLAGVEHAAAAPMQPQQDKVEATCVYVFDDPSQDRNGYRHEITFENSRNSLDGEYARLMVLKNFKVGYHAWSFALVRPDGTKLNDGARTFSLMGGTYFMVMESGHPRRVTDSEFRDFLKNTGIRVDCAGVKDGISWVK